MAALVLGDRLPADFLAAQRRRRVLNGLAAAVVDRGYCGCNVADAVRAAHVARNTFYETFGSKDAAARALVTETFPTLVHCIDPARIERTGLGILAVELAAQSEAGNRQGAIDRAADACGVLHGLAGSITPLERGDELLCALPPGRHGLPRRFVRENQRLRLLTALTATIIEWGYQPVTLADVTKTARVSRRTFYEHFEGKESAALALVAAASEQALTLVESVGPNSGLGTLTIEVVAAGLSGAPRVAAFKVAEAQDAVRELDADLNGNAVDAAAERAAA